VQFSNLNEEAKLEWVDVERLAFEFEYSNRFYGSCTFVAKLRSGRNRLLLDQESLSAERFEVKRGSSAVLLSLSMIYLNHILINCRSLEDLLAVA
jgi:hypothetical protein